MSLLIKVSLDIVEDLFQTLRGNAPTCSVGTHLYRRILSCQEHPDGIANLFSEEASGGSALLQFRMKNLEQVLKAWISQRPVVRTIYDSSRKSSFCKLFQMGRSHLETQAIVFTVPSRLLRAGGTMQNDAALPRSHTLPV